MLQLSGLFILSVINTVTCFVVGVMCLRTFWSLAFNTTTIESWEIERHQVLLRRARVSGGSLPCPDGTQVRIVKQEFPYDIGIWNNIVQGMGGNILTWLSPFSSSPSMEGGSTFKVNEFEGNIAQSAHVFRLTSIRPCPALASTRSRSDALEGACTCP